MKEDPSRSHVAGITAAWFAALVVLLFRDLLWSSEWIISGPTRDIDRYFFAVRSFSFDQIRQGNLPLWNPFICGGIPALGNFQYALLYPLNWLHLVLSAGLAINWIVAMHLWLAGVGMAAWCRWRGTSIPASLVGGTIFMLSGPLACRIYAGHLAYLCVAPWVPLLFLCIDAILAHRRPLPAVLAGSAIVAMQVLAGYPQVAYFSFLAAVLYVGLRLLKLQDRLRNVVSLIGMYALGGAIGAAQVLPALQATSESVRAQSVPYVFATTFSVTPENLLTLVAPRIFGDEIHATVVARWSITETSMFLGSIGTMLVLVGALTVRSWPRAVLAICLLVMLLLSMGSHTSVYGIFYHIVPWMDHFRAPARFSFLFALFAALLAAEGFDELRRMRALRIAIVAGGWAVICFLAAMAVWNSAGLSVQGLWGDVVRRLLASGQTFATFSADTIAQEIARSAQLAAQQLFVAGTFFLVASAGLILSRRAPQWWMMFATILVAEMLIGSWHVFQRFRPSDTVPPSWEMAILDPQSDRRVIVTEGVQQNLPMLLQIQSITGYDPFVPSRWSNVISPLIGAEPQYGEFWVRMIAPSRLWQLFRLGTTLPPTLPAPSDPMPRLSLFTRYVATPDAAASLAAVAASDFDPRSTVILEQSPNPAPADTASNTPAGNVSLIYSSTDHLEISANLTRAAILLITDAYSKGWRAWPLDPGPQQSYDVLPANHALRAIPLAAGKHHILLEYRPRSYSIGLIVSAAALVTWLVGCFVVVRNRKAPS